MNTATLKLNTYAQSAQILINGREPSSYSELANYSYIQFLHTPAVILDAIARELNDNFTLQVCANAYIFQRYQAAAATCELCADCMPLDATLTFSSAERAELLGDVLPAQEYTAHIVCADTVSSEGIPDVLSYGNVSVKISFSEPEGPFARINIGKADPTPELIASACEALIVDPVIGSAAANSQAPELAVCARMEPILSATAPADIEVGEHKDIQIHIYPESCPTPSVVVRSSNPDVVVADGLTISAISAGTATIQVFVSGENDPFFSQTISAQKHIYASSIMIEGIPELLCERAAIQATAKVLPADAEDASSVVWRSSDPKIAECVAGQIQLKKAGTCSITARTERTSAIVEITVRPALRALSLSLQSISTNVGRKVPIRVSMEPETAHNDGYTWKTSDTSVAVVEKDEEGRELVKAVGIGSCTLTCSTLDGTISTQCPVTVGSIMYKKKKRRGLPAVLCLVVLAAAAFAFYKSCGTSLAGDPTGQPSPAVTESLAPEQPAQLPITPEEIAASESLVPLLEEAVVNAQSTANQENGEVTEAPCVAAVYYVATANPDTLCIDSMNHLEFTNAVAIVTKYTFKLDGYEDQFFDRVHVWLTPNWSQDASGNICFDREKTTCYLALNTDPENMQDWFDLQFWTPLNLSRITYN